uniref:Uncharacterized protein n=1 Tax=viral metagenome TaxID=1070528 RepID=A0A6C0BBU9_9ZZZZ
MNIVKTLDQFDEKNIYYCDSIKNNVITDGIFTRIIYSTPEFSLNGVTLLISLHNVVVEKYFSKYKCSFNIDSHREFIEKIRIIEESIMKYSNITNKTPQFKLYEQVRNGNIKIFSDTIEKTNNLFMLKISGIWETDQCYGITYKFVKINHN